MSKVIDMWAGMTGTVLPFAGTSAPTGGGAEAGQLTSEKGSSQAHPNAQPTIVLNSIIKT